MRDTKKNNYLNIMKDQLISFDTAKLAKEKGFDVPCLYWWDEKTKTIQGNKGNRLIDFNNDLEGEYSTPIQSLLQQWLRDKHDININIVFGLTSKKYTIELIKINKNIKYGCSGFNLWIREEFSKKHPISNALRFKTYEEALEIGLVEALKLIDDEVD